MMSGRQRSSCVWCCDSHIFEGPENCKMLAVNIAGRNNGLIKLIVFVVRLREELVYERCVFTLILQRTTYGQFQRYSRYIFSVFLLSSGHNKTSCCSI